MFTKYRRAETSQVEPTSMCICSQSADEDPHYRPAKRIRLDQTTSVNTVAAIDLCDEQTIITDACITQTNASEKTEIFNRSVISVSQATVTHTATLYPSLTPPSVATPVLHPSSSEETEEGSQCETKDSSNATQICFGMVRKPDL